MHRLLSLIALTGTIGLGLVACDSGRSLTGPSFRTSNSNGAKPEVPAGQHPQPNPNKAKGTH